ncbi:hexameric tyrosine-coordinated heme protein [Spirosoma koreense]
MARLLINTTQPNVQIREKFWAVYANDAMMLLAVGPTVAIEFSTIASANDYWRDNR